MTPRLPPPPPPPPQQQQQQQCPSARPRLPRAMGAQAQAPTRLRRCCPPEPPPPAAARAAGGAAAPAAAARLRQRPTLPRHPPSPQRLPKQPRRTQSPAPPLPPTLPAPPRPPWPSPPERARWPQCQGWLCSLSSCTRTLPRTSSCLPAPPLRCDGSTERWWGPPGCPRARSCQSRRGTRPGKGTSTAPCSWTRPGRWHGSLRLARPRASTSR
mmetsp:Transcript_3278/g.13486  ORF Transcript_3278/g.13486 Transcript_3278/m.13486 type:complete len:213 (+) Transcript_3278:2161-2799(+)